jgi:hypothetical protein
MTNQEERKGWLQRTPDHARAKQLGIAAWIVTALVLALVGMMRRHGAPALPVVIGGAIVQSGKDVLSLTGADLASGDAAEALGFCGLTQPAEAALRRVGPVAQLQG